MSSPTAPADTSPARRAARGGTVEAGAAAVLVLAAAVALLAWISLHAARQAPAFDGAMNLQVAWSLAEGDGYRRTYASRDAFPHEIQTNAPFLLPAALAFKAFGVGLWQAQLANLLYLYALAALSFRMLHRRFGLFAGAVAALLVASTPGIITFGLNGYGEIPALAWCIAALVAFPWSAGPRDSARVALAGLCLGLAVATKAVMAIGSASFGACLVVALLTTPGAPIGTRLRRVAMLGLGFGLPLLAFEAWRLLGLGGSEAYRAWWAFQLGAIGREAGIEPVAVDRLATAWQNIGQLADWHGLPRAAVVAWLLGPYVLAAAVLPRTRQWRRNGVLACLLLATAVYFYWWLFVTPPAKAWHRRILDGSVLLNLAWVYAAAMLAEAARFSGGWRRVAAATPVVALLFLAVAFFNANARLILTAPPADTQSFHRAVAILRGLPPEVPVFALGWHSAGALSLLAQRPFLDFNGTVLTPQLRNRRAVLAVEASTLVVGAHQPLLDTYTARPMLPEGSNPQLYELHLDELRDPGGQPGERTPVADLASNDYPFVSGFQRAEANGTRWMTSEGVVGLRYDGSPLLAAEFYAPEGANYAHGRPVTVSVEADGCQIGSTTLVAGAKMTPRLPVPDRCGLRPGQAVDLRLTPDNLLRNAITRDDRRLSVVVGKVGFVPACSGVACPEWPRITRPAANRAAAATGAAKASVAPPQVAAPATIRARPNPVDPCGKPSAPAVEVSWFVPARHATANIWVGAPGIARKLWHATGPGRGARESGPWVVDRTEFVLTDAAGRQLAATTVRARPCAP